MGWSPFLSSQPHQSVSAFFERSQLHHRLDEVNRATHEHKENIKVGYNLRRKVILHLVWALAPVMLWLDPTFFGLFQPHAGGGEFVRHVGEIWLVVGIGALLFRTVQLFFLKDVQTGLVWATKILTDPFNDAKIYCKAPLYLMRGELIDPMGEVEAHRAWIISLSTRRLMDLLLSCGSDHHQPSLRIASAADRILSATSAKSASV
jgi:hypothetical protein